MKSIKETIIAWNTKPPEIGAFPIGEVPRKYGYTSGAAYISVRKMSNSEAEKYTLFEALRLIINYKLSPMSVLGVFSEIKEFNHVWNKKHDIFYRI
jgi:hypothetical protein